MKDKLYPKHKPTSGRDFTYTTRERNVENTGLGIGAQSGVALPPPIVFRATIGKNGKPEKK
jgi:hypothetical protein